MPDGTQIGVTEMRVVAPTAQNTTFTFTGDNVFAYDRGIGRTTLNGTAGADVMIDNSTNGGDRLAGQGGDDYLIGGKGTNVFAPGDGQDYALIRGGAARFEVSSREPWPARDRGLPARHGHHHLDRHGLARVHPRLGPVGRVRRHARHHFARTDASV